MLVGDETGHVEYAYTIESQEHDQGPEKDFVVYLAAR